MFAAIVVAALVAAPVSAADWSGYERHFNVSFPGYTGGTALTNFPVLVRLSSSLNDFNYAKCKAANGGDLRFSDDDGNLIPSEIDTWDPNGTSLVWVKVPTLTRTTVIHAHYGCANPIAMNPQDVWDENYVGVWHLGESGLPLKESSGVSTPFSRATGEYTSNPSAHFAATGMIGGGFNLGGAAASAVYAADDPDLTGFQNLTLEFWVRQDATFNGYMSLLGKAGGSSSDYSIRSYVGTNTKKLEMLFSYNGTSGTLTYSGWEFPALNTWCYYAFAYDHATHTRVIRKNGNTDVSSTAQTFGGPLYDSDAELNLGAFAGGTPFKGQIDELRFSKVARSVAWMKATYDTVNNASFATYGAVNDWTKYSKKFSVTFTGAPSGTLTDFPVLVRVAEGSPEGFSYADCKRGNGADLRFCDANGNLLASEVDTWNTSGTSLIWVKVPTLTPSTKIYAYYGWDRAPNVDSSKVWDDNYVGVWHLGENALPLKESSGVSTPFATSSGSGIAYNAGGKIGGALGLHNAASSSAVYAADVPAHTDIESFSFEFWVYQTAKGTGTLSLLQKCATASSDLAYRIYLDGDSTRLNYQFSATGSNSPLALNGGSWTDAALSSWYYHAFTYDHPSHTRLSWKDGKRVAAYNTATLSASIYDSASPLSLGAGISGATPFKGLIDELRISKIARSESWLKATYDTVHAASFATYSKAKDNYTSFMMIVR
jgi:hypothetical protein